MLTGTRLLSALECVYILNTFSNIKLKKLVIIHQVMIIIVFKAVRCHVCQVVNSLCFVDFISCDQLPMDNSCRQIVYLNLNI